MGAERTRSFELDRQEPVVADLRDRIHDLKNPLSAILANCQYLVAHGSLSGENLEVVNDIAASARELRDLLDGRAQNATGGKSAAGLAKK